MPTCLQSPQEVKTAGCHFSQLCNLICLQGDNFERLEQHVCLGTYVFVHMVLLPQRSMVILICAFFVVILNEQFLLQKLLEDESCTVPLFSFINTLSVLLLGRTQWYLDTMSLFFAQQRSESAKLCYGGLKARLEHCCGQQATLCATDNDDC